MRKVKRVDIHAIKFFIRNIEEYIKETRESQGEIQHIVLVASLGGLKKQIAHILADNLKK